MEPIIKLEDFRRTYRNGSLEVQAVRGVSLDIFPGEFVAIMGASGSGKSTMMNAIGCLDRPTSGRYLLDKVDIGQLDRDELADLRNRKLGFVFQGFNLLSRTSALENVAMPLVYAGVGSRARAARAREALAQVGLAGREDARTNQLSGGQQQRVAMARAIVNRPEILLADEPTGNLDSKMGAEIMRLITELNRSGITVLMVTHDASCAAYAHRQIVFSDGRIVSDGNGAAS